MAEETSQKQPLGQGTMTKKRYQEIINFIKNRYGEDEAEVVAKKIQEVLNFNPNVSRYNEKVRIQGREYRDRKKQEGVSTSVSSGDRPSQILSSPALHRLQVFQIAGSSNHKGLRWMRHPFPSPSR